VPIGHNCTSPFLCQKLHVRSVVRLLARRRATPLSPSGTPGPRGPLSAPAPARPSRRRHLIHPCHSRRCSKPWKSRRSTEHSRALFVSEHTSNNPCCRHMPPPRCRTDAPLFQIVSCTGVGCACGLMTLCDLPSPTPTSLVLHLPARSGGCKTYDHDEREADASVDYEQVVADADSVACGQRVSRICTDTNHADTIHVWHAPFPQPSQ
jgi:hypothetical protein